MYVLHLALKTIHPVTATASNSLMIPQSVTRKWTLANQQNIQTNDNNILHYVPASDDTAQHEGR